MLSQKLWKNMQMSQTQKCFFNQYYSWFQRVLSAVSDWDERGCSRSRGCIVPVEGNVRWWELSKLPVPSAFHLTKTRFQRSKTDLFLCPSHALFHTLIGKGSHPQNCFQWIRLPFVCFGFSAVPWWLSQRSTEWAVDWINKATDWMWWCVWFTGHSQSTSPSVVGMRDRAVKLFVAGHRCW